MKNLILYKLIDIHSVISFDIFDTLIERAVKHPTDVFEHVGKSVLGERQAPIFVHDRIHAEQSARHISKTGEVNLDDIYNVLKEKYPQKCSLLKETEILEELKLCRPKGAMVSAFNYAKQKGKKIYIISDMYLSKNIIEKILKNNGIEGTDKLYISNEYGMNKISGKLFRYIINEDCLCPSKMLHIGDSIKADCIGALKNKMHFYHVPRKNRFKRILCGVWKKF